MWIAHLTIANFGSVARYEGVFSREVNWVHSRYSEEIAAALDILLCRNREPPEHWIADATQISARIHLADTVYTVTAKPQGGRLQLSAAHPSGADATARYRYALAHCPEQDALESFDGQDKTLPLRLMGYRDREENLSRNTCHLADSRTFRKYLYEYIRNFQPEPIHCGKSYQTAITPQGAFTVVHPAYSGEIHLSETEEKLFLFICFLNIAEFWAQIESLRDLHHEKKPLVIQNFAEFLDESVDISGLLARVQKLDRQIIMLCA